jgi:opacity protein-like surface antigen
MKKLFTILCAVILTLSVSAQAQFGAVVGLNMANVSGDDIGENTDMRLGIRLGVSADITLSDAMTLNTGVLYSVKGYSQSLDLSAFGLGTIDMDQSLNYIEVPLNLSFAVADQMSLMAGPYIGLLVGSTITVDGESDSDTDGLATMDFGLNLGAGFAVSEAISINAGYQIGLTALDEDGDNTDVKTSNLVIGMTYSFGGGY